MIFTLTYGSLASGKMCASELELLMATARSNNNKLGVTGCLIYFMGGFVQVLEGEEVIIKGLYEKIKKESRHKNVYTFSNERTGTRDFPNWGMAYYPMDSKNLNEQEHRHFKRNLLSLGELIEPSNITTKLFWTRIKFILESTAILKKRNVVTREIVI
tara:strand:+ start:1535 stop:2008 length:474 start_codon:yes stop_codon:yes gene_type:complete